MEEAEASMHKEGMSYWWLPDGYSRTATAVLPTIHKEPRTSEQVFQLCHPAFISWNDVRTSGDKALVFVDGMPWMVGCAVRGLLHGGETFVPLRRVLAMSRGPPFRTSVERCGVTIFNCCREQQGRCGVTTF